MKNFIIMIALLIPLCLLSQNINTVTPEQARQIDLIFTPEKIIDVSKAISNEKRLNDSIASLEKKLKLQKDIIESHEENIENLLHEISFLNGVLKGIDNSKIITEEPESKISTPFFSNFNLLTNLSLQNFEYKKVNFNVNLYYESNKFLFGIKAESIWLPDNTNTIKTTFVYQPYVGYKIF